MFFKELSDIMGDMAVTIRIQQKNGSMAVSIIPDGVDKIMPLVTSGTPEALDKNFFEEIKAPLEQVKSIIVNPDAFNGAEPASKLAKKNEAPAAAQKPVKKAVVKKAVPTKQTPKPEPKPEATKKPEPKPEATKKPEPTATALETLFNS